MIIRMARPSDWESLMQIDRLCFNDPPEFSELLLSEESGADCMVAELDGKAVCSTFLFPLEWVSGSKTFRCLYLYALGTLPVFRGRGLAAALMQEVWEKYTSEGIQAVLLVPASPSLFDYYRKHGYQTATEVSETVISWKGTAENQAGLFHPVNAEHYFRLREQALAGLPHARWNTRYLSFQQKLFVPGGGFYASADGRGCLALEDSGACKELLTAPGKEGFPAEFFSEESLFVRMPAGTASIPSRPFSMARCTSPEVFQAIRGGYFALVSD